jgi:hypothetical protein
MKEKNRIRFVATKSHSEPINPSSATIQFLVSNESLFFQGHFKLPARHPSSGGARAFPPSKKYDPPSSDVNSLFALT